MGELMRFRQVRRMKMKMRLVLFLLLPVMSFAQTYTFSTLASFPPTSRKGPASPLNLIIDSSGNLYGISTSGGAFNLGTVYEVRPTGALKVLHSFKGMDGRFAAGDPSPIYANLARDSKGDIYGTTPSGGNVDPTCFASGCGTVFKMARKQNGTYTLSTLYSGADGQYPTGLVLDATGNLYALSAFGGLNNCGAGCVSSGSLFEITKNGVFIDLHDFCGSDGDDGCSPTGSPVIDSVGNVYGVTWEGGFFHDPTESEDGGYGVMFSWSPTNGSAIALHTFTGADCQQGGCDTYAPPGIPDGALPLAKLTGDTHGNFYGTTASGGTGAIVRDPKGYGTVFTFSPNGAYAILYEFCQLANCTDGSNPSGRLILDTNGNVYGVAPNGGSNGHGVVFTISPTGQYRVIYNGGSAGVGYAVVMDKAGNLYGTTSAGGLSHNGSVYKLTKHN